MKPLLAISTAVIASLCVGIFAGRQAAASRMAPNLERRSTVGGESMRTKSRAVNRGSAVPVESHDLASLLAWCLRDRDRESFDNVAEIERMDTAAIRDLMTGLMASQAKAGEITHTLRAAARELYHREGEKSLAWAEGLSPAMGRRWILAPLLAAAVGESPALAKPWIDRYRQEYGKNEDFNFAHAAADGAAARSAEELVGLRNILGEGLFAIPVGPFPPGFDNALFLRNFRPGEPETRLAAQRWAVQDRDAAWATAKEIAAADGVKGGQLLGAIHKVVVLQEGEENAARWAVTRLADIPESGRDWALRSLLSESRDKALTLSSLMHELPRESDRLTLVAEVVSPHQPPAQGIAALRALGSEDQQVQALRKLTESVTWMIGQPEHEAEMKQHLRYFTNVMDGLRISTGSREKILAGFRPR